MIYKSFIRKKTSIIYFFIYSLLFVVLGLLISAQNNCIEKENHYHRYSKILVGTEDINIFKEIENIKSINKAIIVNLTENDEVTMISNDSLTDNNVLVPIEYKDDININDIINISYNNASFELKVVGYSDKIRSNFFLLSKDMVKNLDNVKESNWYSINLANWLKYENVLDTLNKIESKNIIVSYFQGALQNELDFKDFYTRIWIFLILLIIVFIGVMVFTSLNIIEDEKNNNHLYKILGYHKSKIIFITINKILILILSSLLLSFILICIIV